MAMDFEDTLSESQADIVSLCLEYVDEEANDIYAYCSIEEGIYTFDVFYGIN